MSRELLAGVGKVPVGAVAKQRRFQSKSKSKERSDTPYRRRGPPLDNAKDVGKSIHLESILHIGKSARNVKVWRILQGCAEHRILAGGTQHIYQKQ